MKFGGNLFGPFENCEAWALQARSLGYSAVYFPLDYTAPQREIDRYVQAAHAFHLTIAEVGIWNNLLHPDAEKRASAMERAVRQLELADYVRANCCVNIAGSYDPEVWDGHHPDNLTPRAFEDITRCTQKILDTVRPLHTFYTLEPMPWMYPDSADTCLQLIHAVDRPGFAAHVDLVNVLSSPSLYYRNREVIQEWFRKVGPWIRSIHAKDITLSQELTVHLSECRPGTGGLDYPTLLTCASQLPDQVTLMLEHMTEKEDYRLASLFVHDLADRLGISLGCGRPAE